MGRKVVVQLLGGFSITSGSDALRSLPRQSVSLLAYLLLHRDRPQTRDLLAGRFWSDLPEDKARRRLSNALWQIKNVFVESGIPELLGVDTTTVNVSDVHPLIVDVEVFLARLDDVGRERRSPYSHGRLADRLASVVTGYTGDLLEGHYDDWIESERYRIRERYLDALHELVRLYKAQSDYRTATRYARDLVTEEPLNETAHRELIRLLAMSGQFDAAERAFNACQDVMSVELDTSVSDETIDLMDQIRAEVSAGSMVMERPDPDSGVLVGRTAERGALLDQADLLSRGRGGVVLIEGDAGMGKSRLLDDFTRSAEWRDLRILVAGHGQLSSLRAYDGLREALVPTTSGLRGAHLAEVLEPVWLAHAAEVLPDLKRHVREAPTTYNLRPDEQPARMSEALARVVLAQGDLSPTVIILEDVHWADDDTMEVLGQLGDRLERSHVLLCLSYRRYEALQSEAVWSNLARLERSPRTVRVSIGPLGADDMRELITGGPRSARLSAEVVDYLVEVSGGNPLFALEVLKDPDALASIHDQLSRGRDPRVERAPVDVGQALLARIGNLSDESRLALQALAVLAESADADSVAEIAGLSRVDALAGLATAVEKGLLVELDDGHVRFNHEQNRRTVYDNVAELDLRRLHSRVVDHLNTADPLEPERLAHHAGQAERWEDAYIWHLRAADRAQEINAYRTSAEHYGQADSAARKAGILQSSRVDVLLRHEAALDMLGRRDEQARLLDALTALDLDAATEVEVVVRRAFLLAQTDRPVEGALLAERALARAERAGLPTHRLLNVIGMARLWSGDSNAAIEWSSAAMDAATDDAARLDSEISLAKALNAMMRYDESEHHARHAMDVAEAINDRRSQIEAMGARSANAWRQGKLDEAERLLSTALELGRAIGYRYGEATSLTNLATVCAAQGRGGQALDLYGRAAEVYSSLDNRRGESLVSFNAAELQVRLLGDYETAAEQFKLARGYFREIGDAHRERHALAGLAEAECRMGNRRLGLRRLRRLAATEVVDDPSVEVAVRRALARDAMDNGDLAGAVDQIEQTASVLQQYPDNTVEGHVFALRAVLSLRSGDEERALWLARRASDLNHSGAIEPHVTALWCSRVFAELGHQREAEVEVERSFGLLSDALTGLEHELSQRAWRKVGIHAEIIEAYERRFPLRVQATLPRAETLGGRPLKADEYRTITWTMSEPDDWEAETAAGRRRRKVERLVEEAEEQGATARVIDLAEALEVSERTIKRDLAELRQVGRVT